MKAISFIGYPLATLAFLSGRMELQDTSQPLLERASLVAECNLPTGSRVINSLEDVPLIVREDLLNRRPQLDVDDDGQPVRSDGSGQTLPAGRFLVAISNEINKLIILYEHGDIDRHGQLRAMVYSYSRPLAGRPPSYHYHPFSNLTGRVCPLVEALFAGVSSVDATRF